MLLEGGNVSRGDVRSGGESSGGWECEGEGWEWEGEHCGSVRGWLDCERKQVVRDGVSGQAIG